MSAHTYICTCVHIPCSICWSLGALRLRCGISCMTHCSELYVLLLVEESPKLLILFTDVTLMRGRGERGRGERGRGERGRGERGRGEREGREREREERKRGEMGRKA